MTKNDKREKKNQKQSTNLPSSVRVTVGACSLLGLRSKCGCGVRELRLHLRQQFATRRLKRHRHRGSCARRRRLALSSQCCGARRCLLITLTRIARRRGRLIRKNGIDGVLMVSVWKGKQGK
jgi:hypothetical protein